ncbi:MAG: alkylmercury lyase family protein [Acidobacteriota bacterium]
MPLNDVTEDATERLLGPLHSEVLRSVVDRGCAPERRTLRSRLRCSAEELDRAFDRLVEIHGVVPHPGTRDVWVIHPFSLAPTPFVVDAGPRRWWGPCAWCSLGIAALVDEPCVITSTLGAGTEQVRLEIAEGRVDQGDLVVHFPIPMVKAWDNVIFTCSTMLLFRDRAEVAAWADRHHLPVGDIQPVAKVFEMAKVWYGQHLSPTWKKISIPEARAVFERLGFTHPIWHLPSEGSEF